MSIIKLIPTNIFGPFINFYYFSLFFPIFPRKYEKNGSAAKGLIKIIIIIMILFYYMRLSVFDEMKRDKLCASHPGAPTRALGRPMPVL